MIVAVKKKRARPAPKKKTAKIKIRTQSSTPLKPLLHRQDRFGIQALSRKEKLEN
jgi:hypothetical protein